MLWKDSEPTFLGFEELDYLLDECHQLLRVLLIGCLFTEFQPAFLFVLHRFCLASFLLYCRRRGSLCSMSNSHTATGKSSSVLLIAVSYRIPLDDAWGGLGGHVPPRWEQPALLTFLG
jgi:hypothetical protein